MESQPLTCVKLSQVLMRSQLAYVAEGHISIVSEIPEPRNAGNRAARLWVAARIPIILIEHEGDHVSSFQSCGRCRTISGIACPYWAYGACVMGLWWQVSRASAMLSGCGVGGGEMEIR